ncbi:RNA polymerase sigma factor [candidate division KSB1 bacterium]|nr:RNA polymerase sigma factor [candidate division KSB1 bacterium]
MKPDWFVIHYYNEKSLGRTCDAFSSDCFLRSNKQCKSAIYLQEIERLRQAQKNTSIQKEKQPLSFPQLVDDYKDMIYRVCLRLLKNQQDAEDIAQDAFIKAFNHLSEFRAESDVSTWLYRIAVNLSLNHLRRRKRQRWLFLEFNDSDENASYADLPSPDSQQPDNIYERNEMQRLLNRAIDSLPESQRAPFILHKLEGLTNQKIAEIMNSSVSSVESRIHRAKRKIQKYFFKYVEEVQK